MRDRQADQQNSEVFRLAALLDDADALAAIGERVILAKLHALANPAEAAAPDREGAHQRVRPPASAGGRGRSRGRRSERRGRPHLAPPPAIPELSFTPEEIEVLRQYRIID